MDALQHCNSSRRATSSARHRRRRRRLHARRSAGPTDAVGAGRAAQVRRLRHAQRRGREPAGLRLHRRRRHRHHHLPPRRDGSGRAHRRADDPGRRAGSRLGARCAWCRRRATRCATATRTPTARAPRATSSCRCAAAAPRRGRCWRAAAAARWGVPASEVKAQEPPADPQAQRPHARLRRGGAPMPPSCRCRRATELRLKKPAEFRYIGKGKTPIVDGFDMTTGKAVYGMDVVLPDMLFAVVARTPVYGGTLRGFDAAEAMKVPGVVKVVEIKGSPVPSAFQPLAGVAVIAEQHLGRDERPQGAQARLGSAARTRATRRTATAPRWKPRPRKPGKVIRNHGDVDAAMKAAAKTVKAEYYMPHLTQAPMEPPAAAARIEDGALRAVGPVPEPAGGAQRRRQAARTAGRQGDGQRHAARRRLRPQEQGRLRDRGRAAGARDRRQAGQGGVDARGRPAPFLLSHGLGRAPRGRARRQAASRWPGCTAASGRR